MKLTFIFLLLNCVALIVFAEEPSTKDLDLDGDNHENLERKHRKKKKQQNYAPCGYGGYSRSFGEKFFGSSSYPDYTYINAPIINYFLGCGVASLPVAPIAAYPAQYGQYGHGGHGHGGNGHDHGGHGWHGGHNSFGNLGGQFGGGNFGGYNQQYQPPYNQGYLGPNRPFQSAVSAAASGFGTALADYITRPRNTYKQINKQVNQYLKPLHKFF